MEEVHAHNRRLEPVITFSTYFAVERAACPSATSACCCCCCCCCSAKDQGWDLAAAAAAAAVAVQRIKTGTWLLLLLLLLRMCAACRPLVLWNKAGIWLLLLLCVCAPSADFWCRGTRLGSGCCCCCVYVPRLQISGAVEQAGFAADNVTYGMGGGLLQKVNRDTMSFATKLNHIVYAGARACLIWAVRTSVC